MISAVYVPGEGVVADEGGPDPHRRDTGLLHSAIASDLRRKIYGQQPAERPWPARRGLVGTAERYPEGFRQ